MLILAAIPILIELFTSEGCSSCPPADELLRKIRTQQPVEGLELLTLSEHVDYWDYIGWKDPNASPKFTRRQNEYAGVFRTRGAYTPQMVVDGQWEFVGSDGRALARAVEQAARQPKTGLRLALSGRRLSIDAEAAPAGTEVVVAVTEHNVASSVSRGENQGRRLLHDSVVRHWHNLGAVKPHMEFDLPAGAGGDAAVVFLQERVRRHVAGAAQIKLR